MAKFTPVTSPPKLESTWVQATKFDSKDRKVLVKGRLYQVIEKHERQLTLGNRCQRGFLGVLAVIASLGFALLFKDVRKLFTSHKENIRFAIPLESGSTPLSGLQVPNEGSSKKPVDLSALSDKKLSDYSPEQVEGIQKRNEQLKVIDQELTNAGIDHWLDNDMLRNAHFTGNASLGGYADIGVLRKDFDKVEQALKNLENNDSGQYKLEDWSLTTSEGSNKNYLRLKVSNLDSKYHTQYIEFRFYDEESVSKSGSNEEDLEKSTLKWVNPYPNQKHKSKECSFPKSLVYPISDQAVQLGGSYVKAPSNPENYLMKRHGTLLATHTLNSRGENLPVSGAQRVIQQREILASLPPGSIESNQKTSYENQEHANMPVDRAKIEPAKKAQHDEWNKTLLGVKELFEVIGVTFWLDAGTAIGAYRYEGGAIMPWDHDADISCLQADFDRIDFVFNCSDREFYEEFGRHKYEFPILNTGKYSLENWSQKTSIQGSSENNRNYLRLKMKDLSDHLDIYMYAIDPSTNKAFWNDPFPGDMPYLSWHKEVPLDMLFPLKRAQFYGEWYSVPANMKDYLEFRYGDLSPNFEWSEDDKKWVKKSNHDYFSVRDSDG